MYQVTMRDIIKSVQNTKSMVLFKIFQLNNEVFYRSFKIFCQQYYVYLKCQPICENTRQLI